MIKNFLKCLFLMLVVVSYVQCSERQKGSAYYKKVTAALEKGKAPSKYMESTVRRLITYPHDADAMNLFDLLRSKGAESEKALEIAQEAHDLANITMQISNCHIQNAGATLPQESHSPYIIAYFNAQAVRDVTKKILGS